MQLTKTLLITGPAGSGKTHLYEYLKSHGVPAADTDEILGLGRWVDEVGIEVQYPSNADKTWLTAHRYVWNPEVLRAYIRLHAPIALLGLSMMTQLSLGTFSIALSILRFRLMFCRRDWLIETTFMARQRNNEKVS